MTQSRWLIPCAALLLGSAAWGQEPSPERDCRTQPRYEQPCAYTPCSPCSTCPAQATEAARAPYYDELPQLLFEEGFVDSGSCAQHAGCGSCGPRDQARRESRKHRLSAELLK